MEGHIYLLSHDKKLIDMVEESYDSEKLLQELLADYPDLLASDQIGESPRRWILISREIGVPDNENMPNRWSLDHLFLDQDGIPTLIEVKRSSDTRIRREVVGQMLDYAANAVLYWKPETIRAKFETLCKDIEPAQVLAEKLNVLSAETFWQTVETNLRIGKIRLIFVADDIPNELRRIIEFLNEQMSPTEVLGIAIRQFKGQGLTTLVPTIYGQTAQTQYAKANNPNTEKWTEETFFPELASRTSHIEVAVARKILDWAYSRRVRIWWGEGKRSGTFMPIIDVDDEKYFLIAIRTDGKIEMQFQHMKVPPFNDDNLRQTLLNRLNENPDVNIPNDSINRRPHFFMKALKTQVAIEHFIEVLDWYVATVQNYHRSRG